MRKRIASIILSVCLCLSLLPTAAFAAGGAANTKTIMLGTSGISDPTKTVITTGWNRYTPNSYIYFGANGSKPIKWRVLDADMANDGITDGMFLLSEYLLTDSDDVYFNKNNQ